MKTFACLLSAALAVTVSAAPAFTSRPLSPRSPRGGGPQFRELPADSTGVTVPNVYNDPRMWGDRFREFTLGALETGIAVGDFDLNGRPDIFAISRNGPCALYMQVAPFKFMNTAAAAGVDCAGVKAGRVGATVVDINQDGWPDLYVCLYDSPNLLFVNNGDGSFTECAHQYGLDVKDACVQASFADFDGDGALDCYIVTNILDFSKNPLGRRHYLLHNDGHGRFADVTQKAGIWGFSQGHSAIWFDANQDGWPDLYVANDFETPDRFYLNNGDGTFTDVVDQRLPHVTYFSMGSDSGDINNDGLVDFMVADMRDRTRQQYMTGMEEAGRGLWEMERTTELIPQYMWNAVYLNTGTARYAEMAHLAGMEATGWTWSARFADLDCDGRLDAFFTAGMVRNFVDADLVDKQNVAPDLASRAAVWKNAAARTEQTVAYRNNGDLSFTNVSQQWGLNHKGISFGCALVDLDNDGDLDLVYINFDGPPTVVRNDTESGHRLVVSLQGRAPNLNGIGAEIRLESASGIQVRQLYTERGIVSSEMPVAVFGLGGETAVKKLVVHWPSGETQTIENPPVDRALTIMEPPLDPMHPPRRAPARVKSPSSRDSLYVENAGDLGIEVSSSAKPFDEFARQRLLPGRLAVVAPAVAAADVDGDGRSDVFVSGVQGQPGRLYLGQPDGTFTPAPQQPWEKDRGRDDGDALFADLNGDGRPDLVLASGGVARKQGDPALGAHVYWNLGGGAFSAEAAPGPEPTGESSSALAVADFEGSGKPGLFVGGRVVPGRWPETPRSALYRNTGSGFVDVTDELAPGLRRIGMVTAAQFADVDRDGRPDLLVAVDWGNIVYFHNTGHGFENRTEAAGLAGPRGWWRSLAVADVNGDGRPDLIAGNVGLNTKYRATAESPAVVYAGDLDGRGRSEIVEAEMEGGRAYPLRGRSKLAYAFPWLAKKFPTYEAYSHASIDQIFDARYLEKAIRLSANELRSGLFLQDSAGRFVFHPLPNEAQLAPIQAFALADFDGDGAADLYCVGNDFGPEPSTGRFDGNVSILLRGDGRGGFSAVLPARSGMVVPCDARGLAVVKEPKNGAVRTVFVSQCNGPLLAFTRASEAPALAAAAARRRATMAPNAGIGGTPAGR